MALQFPSVARSLLRSAVSVRNSTIGPNSSIYARAFSSSAPASATEVKLAAEQEAPPPTTPSTGGRKRRSSYQYRAPRYYRGPYSPAQPPPPNDPRSREYVPGPFTSERLEDHYYDTLRADLMLLTYDHLPPGYHPPRKENRLRAWDDSSPYHKNRPLRGPRGGSALTLLTPPRTFRNVPKLESVVVHTMVKQALDNPAYIAVAGTVVQAITGVRAEVVYSKKQLATWGLTKDKPIGVKSEIKGPQAYRFLSSLIDVVMPRIKDYKGIKGSTGDGSGNFAFGFTPTAVQMFPEVEVNFDQYPPKMIPGIHVIVKTTATNDEDARILARAFGIPFYGKFT